MSEKNDEVITKYLLHGDEVVILEKTNHGYIVEPVYEYEDDEHPDCEPRYYPPRLVQSHELYDTPPAVSRKNEELKTLTKTVSDLREERDRLKKEILEIQTSHRTAWAKAQRLALRSV